MTTVSNSTPLIARAKINRLDLLKDYFRRDLHPGRSWVREESSRIESSSLVAHLGQPDGQQRNYDFIWRDLKHLFP